MSRGSAQILDDDEEIDLLDFMLDACAIDSRDFFFDERVLTKENLEKNFSVLIKMVENRSFRRASYFVIGYLILITGIKVSESLRQEILNNTQFSAEEGCWFMKDDEMERKIYLKDFRQKIRKHVSGQRLHPIRLIYLNGENDLYIKDRALTIIGLSEYQKACETGEIYKVKHINLQGWGLNTIPKEVFEINGLESLCLDYNQLTQVPEEISKLTSLKTLNLDYNEFTNFPESLTKLQSLEFLTLDNNYITTLPESIRDFISLKELYIRMNNINRIPSFLSNANFKIEYKFYNYP
ncbi:MAG: leucine-rich repeat domain-containing protein [Promethearchaeota archaeon]|nr:MAG: leucine-rich repeat domain-containing protein [Candidatus Lokiarchaeota archaeon]